MTKKVDLKPYLDFFRRRNGTTRDLANHFGLTRTAAWRRVTELRPYLVIVGYTEPEGRGKGENIYALRISAEQQDALSPGQGPKLTGAEKVRKAKEKKLKLLALQRDIKLANAKTEEERAEIRRKHNWACGNVQKKYILQDQKLKSYFMEYKRIQRKLDAEKRAPTRLQTIWGKVVKTNEQSVQSL